LRALENSLKQANETIKVCIIMFSCTRAIYFFAYQTYESDMDRLRQALLKSERKNEEIEQDISRAYIDELKMKTDRLQVNLKLSWFM